MPHRSCASCLFSWGTSGLFLVLETLARDLAIELDEARDQRLVFGMLRGEGLDLVGIFENALEKFQILVFEKLTPVDLAFELQCARQTLAVQAFQQGLDSAGLFR